jgi:hypothetical protein
LLKISHLLKKDERVPEFGRRWLLSMRPYITENAGLDFGLNLYPM